MIFILQQILPKYRYDILKHLPLKMFSVYYSDDIKDNSLKSVSVSDNLFHPVKIKKVKGFYFQYLLSEIKSKRPKGIVFTPELKNLSFVYLYLLKFYYGYKLIPWTHGINSKDYYTKISLNTWMRILIIRLSDKVLVYSADRAKMLGTYTSNPIVVASNTLETENLDKIYLKLKAENVSDIKLRNNITDKFTFIYVGRLIEDKQVDGSIEIFSQILKYEENSTLLIIGGGPDQPRLEKIAKDLNIDQKVRFFGETFDAEKVGELLYISDFQLHLGYVGLSVVNSMCYETPIVTIAPSQQGPFHSPEFIYLKKDINAVICDRLEDVSNDINGYLIDTGKLNKLKKNARSTFEMDCSMHNFLNAFSIISE